MILKQIRSWKGPTSLIGKLYVDDAFDCYCLENRALAIPPGTYRITLYNSPHAGHIVPLLIGVPNRSEIEIHCGNTACDSKGCLIVGAEMGNDSVMMSHVAFNRLLPLIQAALARHEAVLIDVKDPT